MVMRGFLFALAVLCAACSPLAGHKGGYNLEIRASDDVQFFLVTAPDGHVVGARATSKGESALMDDAAIHALLAAPPPAAAITTSATGTSAATSTNTNTVSIQAPGVSIQASGDDNGKGDNGDAHVSLNVGGPAIQIDAHGNGEDGGNAHVVINGVDAKAARDFIVHADGLSPQVQAQMLAALGFH